MTPANTTPPEGQETRVDELERMREALVDIAKVVHGVSAMDDNLPWVVGFVQGRIPFEIRSALHPESEERNG